MSVVVHFVNGNTKEYSRAEAANLQDSVFKVSKWNPKRQKLEDLEVFSAARVTHAEVFDSRGVREEIIRMRHGSKGNKSGSASLSPSLPPVRARLRPTRKRALAARL